MNEWFSHLGQAMSSAISGPMTNNDTSFPTSGKATSGGHTSPFSADSNMHLHIYESKVSVEKYYWPIFDPVLKVMSYFKVLRIVKME